MGHTYATVDSRRQFETEVFPAELSEIGRRRGRLGLATPDRDRSPSVELGLVGLALSGGGIRSAALSLGLLQVFAARAILGSVDYVSTVSGGGLIGSCLSVLLNSPDATPGNDRFPLGFDIGRRERPAVRYLRNHDKYLLPRGPLGPIRLPAMVLRGLVANLALMLPILIAAVQATELLFFLFYLWGIDRPWFIPLFAAALFAVLALMQPVLLRLWLGYFTWKRRNQYEQLLSGALLVLVIVIVLVPVYLLIQQAFALGWTNARLVIDRGIRIFGIAAGLITVLMLAGTMKGPVGAIASKLALLTLGAVGYLIVFAQYFLLTLYEVGSPAANRPVLWDGQGEWLFLGAGVLGLLYAVFFANPNLTSQHAYFRDRMSRTFLFSVDDSVIHRRDDIKLSELNRAGSSAPYHLLNTTLNLQGAADLDLAGRDADFFLFSRHYVGSPTTGYGPTEQIEQYDRHLNLGTAMAISGAGLAPNMGTQTVSSLVFLLALLDLRLDYWLPNPATIRRLSPRKRILRAPGPDFILKEALARLDARGAYVNLSDGGQIENLGVYELLRRRCRLIIAVDASQDPTYSCSCLADVIRYARIDLGILIDIDVTKLRPAAPGFTAAHWTVGVIRYSDRETGTLIYVKSSLTGDEPEAIQEYHASSPAFPQESSDNQFFSESQFEAYRALGEHIASGLCDAVRLPTTHSLDIALDRA